MVFKWAMGDTVQLGATEGKIIGRSELDPDICAEHSYYLDFIHPETKLPTREWFPEGSLTS